MASIFTCITCGVAFKNPETQRQHYKTDWHRYNLKRKVAELSAVTAEDFEKKVLNQRSLDAEKLCNKSVYCVLCKKNFLTVKSYENHIKSKKHKEKLTSDDLIISIKKEKIKLPTKTVEIATQHLDEKPLCSDSDIETDSEVEELSSDEWNEEDIENPINKNICLFCKHHSKSLLLNLKHMSQTHSFFLPDLEYCINLKGLLLYLGAKVFYDHICLWCNGKIFNSVQSVQKHMIDKGHTNVYHEGEALMEFISYYDYSSSYPDYEEKNPDEEVDIPVLNGSDYQLVLPSGAVIGHRSLMRYYRQYFNPNSGMLMNKKMNKIINNYRKLGYSPVQKETAQRKARDLKFMTNMQQKFSLQMGCKSNKLQRHFRPQVNF